MSVKVADTIVSMNPDEFPAMMGESVNLVKSDSTEKSLQAMYEDGELGGDGTVQFVGTKAQWNALSDTEKEKYDGKEVIITDDVGDGGIIDAYSTTETKTNKVWIDGKPIYQITVKFTPSGGSSYKTIAHGVANIDKIISFEGYMYSSTDNITFSMNSYQGSSSFNELAVGKTDIRYIYYLGSGVLEAFVTFRYTKTE